MNSNDSMIETKDLNFAYPAHIDGEAQLVLQSINLTVKKGEFVAVLGHNGSGKSTLAKHFNCILLPSGGKVYIDSMDCTDFDLLYEIRQRVGMIFQNPDNQLVANIVEEDVAFAPENLGVPQEEIRRRVDYALNAVGMLEYKDRAPHQLSGGQRQRVAIAGVLAMKPLCIVMDEPTAMLDPVGRREVMETVLRLNREEGITLVLITHYMNEAVKADRVVVMDHGKIVMDGTPKEVFIEVEKLEELGLDVPQVTELAFELRKNGFDISPDVLTADECVAALIPLLEGVKA